MSALNDKKSKLLTVKKDIESSLKKVNADIGETFLNPKSNADALTLKASNLKIKLEQVSLSIEAVDVELVAEQKQNEANEIKERTETRKAHVEKACNAINKAWKLQEQMCELLKSATMHNVASVSRGDDIELQVRLMVGQIMGDCQIHHVSAAAVGGVPRDDMGEESIKRIQSNLVVA